MQSQLLYFDDERAAALRLAEASGLAAAAVERHRFPDDELRLCLPLGEGEGGGIDAVLGAMDGAAHGRDSSRVRIGRGRPSAS